MRLVRRRPNTALRVALKMPALLYDMGAGRLLGHRFLLLTHRGRTSGRVYRTPLEVVRWDRARREATVISAWGTSADWVRNIEAAAPLELRIAGERWPSPAHRLLDDGETVALLDEYRREHRIAARVLARVLGWPHDAAGSQFDELARAVTAVAFQPRTHS